jgi:hypothetical protein
MINKMAEEKQDTNNLKKHPWGELRGRKNQKTTWANRSGGK